MKVHKGVTGLYFFKFGMDPHIQKDEDRRAFYNPIKLAAQWLCTIEHYLLRGETLLVNSNGGIMPMEGAKILDTVESTSLHWDDRFDDEVITLSRWPQGRHWYLCVGQVVYRILKVSSLWKTEPSKQPDARRLRDGGSRMFCADRRPDSSERRKIGLRRPPLCVPSPPRKTSDPGLPIWTGSVR